MIDWTLHRKPADGSTHWSSRKLGSALGIDHMRVARAWAKRGCSLTGVATTWSAMTAVREEGGATIGLYLKPPADAAVFCVDEKSTIQALDRCIHLAAFSGARRTSRIRILSPRHSFSLRGLEHGHRRSPGQDGQPSHQRRVCGVSERGGRHSARRYPNSYHRRQPFTHKTKPSKAFLSAHICSTPLHSDLFLLSQSGRDLVLRIQRDLIARGSSHPRAISIAKSWAISAITIKRPCPSSGPTKMPIGESDKSFTFICYTALVEIAYVVGCGKSGSGERLRAPPPGPSDSLRSGHVFKEAQATVNQVDHTGINDPIFRKALELVAPGLRLHAGFSTRPLGETSPPFTQRMEDSQPRCAGERFKYALKFGGAFFIERMLLGQGGLRRRTPQIFDYTRTKTLYRVRCLSGHLTKELGGEFSLITEDLLQARP